MSQSGFGPVAPEVHEFLAIQGRVHSLINNKTRDNESGTNSEPSTSMNYDTTVCPLDSNDCSSSTKENSADCPRQRQERNRDFMEPKRSQNKAVSLSPKKQVIDTKKLKKVHEEMKPANIIPSLTKERFGNRKCSYIQCKKKVAPYFIVYECSCCDDTFYCDSACAEKHVILHSQTCSLSKASPMRVLENMARGITPSETLARIIEHCKTNCMKYPDRTDRCFQTEENTVRADIIANLMTKYKYRELPDCSTQEEALQRLSQIKQLALQRNSLASETIVDISILEKWLSPKTGLVVFSRASQVNDDLCKTPN